MRQPSVITHRRMWACLKDKIKYYQSVEGSNKKKTMYVPKKEGKSKSKTWSYFEKFTDKDGIKRARCLGCNKLYAADSSCNGTSSMLRHITICPKYPDNLKDP